MIKLMFIKQVIEENIKTGYYFFMAGYQKTTKWKLRERELNWMELKIK